MNEDIGMAIQTNAIMDEKKSNKFSDKLDKLKFAKSL